MHSPLIMLAVVVVACGIMNCKRSSKPVNRTWYEVYVYNHTYLHTMGFAAAVCNDEPMASQFKLLDRIKMRRSSIFTSPGILEHFVNLTMADDGIGWPYVWRRQMADGVTIYN
ncbi:unnamed protein product [Cuscuta campestris]|uniref:Uncharacterized protein n=1 Tax=Cuscuta campestris TaxID=132261 RepID=A0A484NIZ6_9ASTE|nr:unnamed protein product [Cuscuta campestris]